MDQTVDMTTSSGTKVKKKVKKKKKAKKVKKKKAKKIADSSIMEEDEGYDSNDPNYEGQESENVLQNPNSLILSENFEESD